MKYKHMSGAALILAAAMALTACGAGTVSTDSVTNTGVTDISSAEQTGMQTVFTLPDAVQVDVDAAELADVFADAFSNRDLSGTWDAADAVRITLNGTSVSSDSDAVTVSGSDVTITAAGTYLLSGTLENGTIIVDAGKDDKVQLVVDGVSIHSDTFAAIYVRQADKVFLTMTDNTINTLSNGGTFEAIDENNVDGVIFSKDDLTLNGTGTLMVTSPGKHGIVCKDDLVVTGGTYEITAAGHAVSGKDSVSIADGTFTLTADKDGIHAQNSDDDTLGSLYIAGGTFTIKANDDAVHAVSLLQIDAGTFDINASEGIEGTYIRINDGTINIYASDDGINAARKSSAYTPTIEINGGAVTVEVGPGDTDGIDANGNLIITGGTIDVTGNSTFDIDGTVTFTGGTVTVNGQQVDTIPNQMGGRGGMGRNFGGSGTQNGGMIPGGGQWNNGTPGGRWNNANPDSAQTPDENAENGVRKWGGKGGRDRFADENGSAENNRPSDGRTGKTRGTKPGQTEIPDAVTSPTQTAQNV